MSLPKSNTSDSLLTLQGLRGYAQLVIPRSPSLLQSRFKSVHRVILPLIAISHNRSRPSQMVARVFCYHMCPAAKMKQSRGSVQWTYDKKKKKKEMVLLSAWLYSATRSCTPMMTNFCLNDDD